MKTINQAGDPLADYDARVRNWQRTGREDGFEDDATASMPSRVMRDALRPDEPVGVVGFGRMLIRAIGYCMAFVLWSLIGVVAITAAMVMSPQSSDTAPVWVLAPLAGILGVIVQFNVNQRRANRRR